MKMSDEKDLPVSQDIAWQALNDIELLQSSIPGCESIELKEDGSYGILITAAVGPIRAKFKGDMRMLDVIAPTSYRLEFNVQGGAVGYGRGDATVALTPSSPGSTRLQYTTEAKVGGKLAQVGARLIDMAAQKMAGEFFDAFQAELTKRYAPASDVSQVEVGLPQKARGNVSLWTRFNIWFGKLFA